VHCKSVRLKVSRELTAEGGGWQLEVSPAQELAAKTSLCEMVTTLKGHQSEAEECLLLEAATKRD
jgi:hypothetical protein